MYPCAQVAAMQSLVRGVHAVQVRVGRSSTQVQVRETSSKEPATKPWAQTAVRQSLVPGRHEMQEPLTTDAPNGAIVPKSAHVGVHCCVAVSKDPAM